MPCVPARMRHSPNRWQWRDPLCPAREQGPQPQAGSLVGRQIAGRRYRRGLSAIRRATRAELAQEMTAIRRVAHQAPGSYSAQGRTESAERSPVLIDWKVPAAVTRRGCGALWLVEALDEG